MSNADFRDKVLGLLKENGFELVSWNKHAKLRNPDTNITVHVGYNMRDRNMGNKVLKQAKVAARLG